MARRGPALLADFVVHARPVSTSAMATTFRRFSALPGFRDDDFGHLDVTHRRLVERQRPGVITLDGAADLLQQHGLAGPAAATRPGAASRIARATAVGYQEASA